MGPHRKHRSCNERPHCTTGPTGATGPQGITGPAGPSSPETDCFQDIKNTLQHCTGRIVSLLLSGKNDPIQGRISSVGEGSIVFVSENATSMISICNILSITPIPLAYITANNFGIQGIVSIINTFTNTVIGPPILTGPGTSGIAITPDGSRAYVTTSGRVLIIDTFTNTIIGEPITVGQDPFL